MNLLQSYKIEMDEDLYLIVIAFAYSKAWRFSLSDRERGNKKKKFMTRDSKVQVSLMSLGGDMGDVQGNEASDTSRLASLLYSRNDKLDEKI